MSWTPLASSVSESYTRKMTKRKTPRHFCRGVAISARCRAMSGSSSALLRRRPLRTVRASFPAYGSSLKKFNRRVEPVAHLFPRSRATGCDSPDATFPDSQARHRRPDASGAYGERASLFP